LHACTTIEYARKVGIARKRDEIRTFMLSPNARANAAGEQKSRACALVCITSTPRARLCAEQKNFAQLALRKGIKRPESIKKERISTN